jgi:hypothetical protein
VVGDLARGRAFTGELARALGHCAATVPRGDLDAGPRAELAAYRALAASLGEVSEERDQLVAFFPDAPPLPLPPPYRVVAVASIRSAALAAKLVAPFQAFITTIGGELSDDATLFLNVLAGVRRSELGQMQRPPFDGPVDRRASARERGREESSE